MNMLPSTMDAEPSAVGLLPAAPTPAEVAPAAPTDERRQRRDELRDEEWATDVFSRQGDGTTIAAQYQREGIRLTYANMDRINGWAEIHQRLGDLTAGI